MADFQAELAKANIHIPSIFMTGHGDIPMSVQAMKAGAIDFLSKPFRDQDMLGEQTRNGDVLILHRYALVWKILYQGIKQLFLLHNCRG
jgi:ActR/RegA family two-component response regulator